jgi:glycosyltransferase involved in cell wall biosynthesis
MGNQMIGSRVEIASASQQEAMNTPSSTDLTCSVVIPTWNEEPWLPRLLAILTTCPCVDEVVVADNESTDMTRDLAGRFGCRITSGGTPARARNRGAEAARRDIIAFIDADTLVPRRTLERAVTMIATGQADVYHCRVTPLSHRLCFRIAYRAMDWWFRFLGHTRTRQGVGNFVAVRRSAFCRIGGFQESLLAGEDADFFRRAGKASIVHYDSAHSVYTSARRLRLEYPICFGAKTLFWAILRLTGTSASVFRYKWLPYPPQYAKDDLRLFQEMVDGCCNPLDREVPNGQ